jgi:GR25 family glycosyltransferase involved in LPS biosynthesis
MRAAVVALLLILAASVAEEAAPAPAAAPGTWPLPPPSSWPLWVITLARLPARLRRFRAKTEAYTEFPRLVEFPATDGRALDVPRDDRVTPLARVRTRDGAGRRSHSDLQTAGMIGLYVTHVELWKAFLASGEPVGIVLEDDAVVGAGTAAAMRAAIATMPPPSAWDVWLLGTVAVQAARAPPEGFDDGWQLVTAWWGTQAYALTRRGAQALLAHAYPTDAQIDAYMAHMAALGEVVVVTRARGDVDIPQFAWWQQSTSIQKFELWCDTCSLPDDFSLRADNAALIGLGLAAGVALGVAAPLLVAAVRAIPPLAALSNALFPHRKRRA